MSIETRFFGEIEVDENKVINFESGIPGFEDLKRFLFMTNSNDNTPFCWLQSIEDTDVVFTIIDIFPFLPGYNPIVEMDLMKEIGEFDDVESDLAIYNITVIPEKVQDITVNLKAPVVINLKTNKAKQVICNNEEYPIKFKIYDMVKKDGEKSC